MLWDCLGEYTPVALHRSQLPFGLPHNWGKFYNGGSWQSGMGRFLSHRLTTKFVLSLHEFFWLVLCYVVWRQVTNEKNVSILMVCLGNKQLRGASHELFQHWSIIWSIFMPVWSKYLHSSFLSKQKYIYPLKLAIIGNFGLIRDFTAKFLESFCDSCWLRSMKFHFSRNVQQTC